MNAEIYDAIENGESEYIEFRITSDIPYFNLYVGKRLLVKICKRRREITYSFTTSSKRRRLVMDAFINAVFKYFLNEAVENKT
jgi:hypothetical protein